MPPVEEPVTESVAAPEGFGPGHPPPGIKPGQARDPVTGRLLKKNEKPKTELGTGRVPDVEAMEYVTSHALDETNQHAYFRRLMEKEPKWFADRLAGLQAAREAAQPSGVPRGTPLPEYDGKGACPTCGRAPEVEAAAEPVETLIDELLGRETDDGTAV
jgi:hypothetical protein